MARYGELPRELVETVKKSTDREDVFDKEKTVLFGKPTVDLRTAMADVSFLSCTSKAAKTLGCVITLLL